jgi:hypothetical protein
MMEGEGVGTSPLPTILHIGTRWRGMISFNRPAAYPSPREKYTVLFA